MRDMKIRTKLLATQEQLSEDEIKALVYNNVVGFDIEHEEEGESGDWDKYMYTVVKCKDGNNQDRLFEITWLKGLTEYQENSYWDQPVEVKKIVETKTIDVVSFIPV